ncbi:MFS transporter [Streptomyces ruber]|uniref:MFS transporter n=2 Tax=Streptomyces TaxID=1883 RepID=A0A918EP65_9ACTN|nr:MFS transporter [Streptomyces ruber]GGQ47987.1 MFS transporter [Streptomyces ruber]
MHRSTARSVPPPPGGRQARTGFTVQLVALVAMAFAIPAQLYLAIPVAGGVQRAFGVSAAAAAWTGSAFSLAYAVGFLAFGPLSDRVGRRPVLAFGTLATAAATGAVAVSPGFGWFLAFRVVQGLAAAAFAPVALAYVAEHAPPARRAVALSFLTTGLLGAGVAGQVYGQAVADRWRLAFWPAALVYAAAAVAFWLLLAPARGRSSASARGVAATLGGLLRHRGTVAVFASALTVFGSFVALYAALNAHLGATAGYDAAGLLGVQALGALGLVAGPVVNRLAGARGPRPLTVAGFVVASAGLLLAQVTAVPAVLLAGTVVFVGGISLVVPGLVGLLHRLVPDAAGAAVSFNTFVLFVGSSLGQLAAAHTGYRTVAAVSAAATLAAACGVAVCTRPPVTRRPSDGPPGRPPGGPADATALKTAGDPV